MTESTLKIDEDGNRFWVNEKSELHRTDGPAVERINGHKEWWINGDILPNEESFKKEIDRLSKSPPKMDDKGNKIWRNEKGELHRTDGPAWEGSNGNIAYYVNGLPHRTDGPAVKWADGFETWHLNGNHYLDEKSFRKALENMEKCQDVK